MSTNTVKPYRSSRDEPNESFPNESFLNDSFLNESWVKLSHVEKVDYSGQEWVFRKDQLERRRIVICLGPCRVIVDGVRIYAASGTVIACEPRQWVETGGPSKEPQAMYFLEFEQGRVADGETAPDTDEIVSLRMNECRIHASVRLGHQIHLYWERSATADRMRAQAVFCELLALLVEYREHGDSEAPDVVKREIDCRYADNLPVDELAALTGVSRYQLMRGFKERYGKSIVEYITEVRLLHAKRLMQESKLSAGEIAERVGFRSEQYFRTVFKKEVGIAPAVYLRNRSRKVAAYSWPILGILLPLQVVPHAAPIDHYWTDEFSRKYSSDIAIPLGHHYEFNRRALRQLMPDCIIGLDCTITPEEAALLEEIAPVLLLPWMEAGWRQHLRMAADFLGMAEDAAAWLGRYEQKAAALRERARDAMGDQKVLVVKVAGNELQIWGRKAMTVLYDDLGLIPSRLTQDIDWYEPVEPDRLALCDEDCRFIVSVNGDSHSQARWRKLQADNRWTGLRQVREQAVHFLPGHQAWVYPWLENSALHQERLLDRIAYSILCGES
ncbi:AraC family transcriptional regulator [Cohnella fermenti]|uniref:Helix-turn-helix domain-containing protein n=1 Tax=Cohnella fermenti TaxID=2565925 RepID=A0A4S4BQG8_9BACL|nr:helix-turn-helix domain-containing protein [Cohnella fermenti]THF74842.1 helix-turn-helix domain-containing protein [Cohnella fermenti]